MPEEQNTITLRELAVKHYMPVNGIRTQFQMLGIDLGRGSYTEITIEMYNLWLKEFGWAIESAKAQYDAEYYAETPANYGYRNWSEMELNEVWEGNIDEYNAHNSDEYNSLNEDE